MATWTPNEDKILMEFYESAPRPDILFKLPGRDWRSCYKRSVILGLYRPEDAAWKKNEEDILKEFYSKTPKNILMPMLPGRTWKAISLHALNFRLNRTKEITQEEVKNTNQARLGVDYPQQSSTVREKTKEKVKEIYGVDHIFQSEKIKEQIAETNLKILGFKNPNQSPIIRELSRQTCQRNLGVDNPFQLVDRVKAGMIAKYGADSPLKVPEIKARQQATNIKKYGFITPSKNEKVKKTLKVSLNSDRVKEKKYKALKEKDNFKVSKEEVTFYNYLKSIYSDAEHHKLHPITKTIIDYYLPSTDIWLQYDGCYWHGLQNTECEGSQKENIKKTILRDKFENEIIQNLVRFMSDDVEKAIKDNNIIPFIKECIDDKLEELKDQPAICHQFKKKIQFYQEDLKQLPFNPDNLKASDFDLSPENLSDEIVTFIEKYEWLGTIGVSPKWCFTARFKGALGGVLLINEPTAYSKILGEETQKYEALIQRGASASWAPKNLGSRLIMFSCNWMVKNTEKRAFMGYADTSANEKGIIYRACNFDYLGDNFGVSELLKHPSIPRLFTSHYLKRTSIFIRWCRDNNITTEKHWFKENKFKNLETIPPEIKEAWYSWGKKIISESEQIKIEKKMKYVLILGKNKKETKILKSLRQYEPKAYPNSNKNNYSIPPIVNAGKTLNRENDAKNQFIIDNYRKKTRNEIAKELGEAPRWVKRIISKLVSQGKIIQMRPSRSQADLLTMDKWIPEIKDRAITLRRDQLKSNKEICDILKIEFNFIIHTQALGSWFAKFNCPFPSKEDWLKRFLPIDIAKNLLEKNYRRIDVVNYLKDLHGVYISEDTISLYLRSLPI